jgi:hypothetical protein
MDEPELGNMFPVTCVSVSCDRWLTWVRYSIGEPLSHGFDPRREWAECMGRVQQAGGRLLYCTLDRQHSSVKCEVGSGFGP